MKIRNGDLIVFLFNSGITYILYILYAKETIDYINRDIINIICNY